MTFKMPIIYVTSVMRRKNHKKIFLKVAQTFACQCRLTEKCGS